jgi:hypothetical protein
MMSSLWAVLVVVSAQPGSSSFRTQVEPKIDLFERWAISGAAAEQKIPTHAPLRSVRLETHN